MRNAIAKNFLKKYAAPPWAEPLKYKPSHKLELAQLPTPIHRWYPPNVSSKFKLSIKRDDLTGCTITGTKIRKLEFILGRAVHEDCNHVITAGSTISNCCRTVASASRMLGMTPHFIMWDAENQQGSSDRGNMSVNKIMDCDIHHLPYTPDEQTHLVPMMNSMKQVIEEDVGEKAAIISYGGFDPAGLHGSVTAFQEMITQGVLDEFDDIVLAVGSGATATGLAISNYLTGSKLRIHAFISDDSSSYLFEHLAETLETLELGGLSRDSLLDVVEDCHGDGYGISSQEELDLLLSIARTTGILLDPIYTVKAVKRLFTELNERPERFKGDRVLFLHTGGIFASLDGRLDISLASQSAKSAPPRGQTSNYAQ